MFYDDVSYDPKLAFPRGFSDSFLAEICPPHLHAGDPEESWQTL
jgi:hypothetical protein